jgi:hypothetical protein
MSFKEMLGIRFGKLTVIERLENFPNGTAAWNCLCDCGIEKKVAGTKLRAGKQKSCGCSSPKFSKESISTHGMSKTRVYRIWAGMHSRCRQTKNKKIQRLYLDKGIKVCERWNKFENFYEDMGDPPDGMSIDRINGDKGYEPSNCRWATSKQQANNMSSNRLIEYNNKKMTISLWAKEIGVKPNTLNYRIRRGMPLKDALKTQVLTSLKSY